MADPLIGREVGGVELDAKLGSGGMGAVYAGRDLAAGGERRAVKVISATSHEAYQARFVREAELGHALDHPLVVRVYRHGTSGDYLFMVMELVDGEDLAHVLHREAPLPWANVAMLGRDIAQALAAVHARDVVHRDLKPQNVLLDGEGRLKLADFGLARWRQAPAELGEERLSLTITGDSFGTPTYMAPEQFADAKSVGPAADLYSLGVVLFEALAGRVPFNASTPHGLARLHREVPPPALDALAADAPVPLRQLIASLLEKDPRRRPPSAQDVSLELAAIARGSEPVPVELHTPETKTRFWAPSTGVDASTRPPAEPPRSGNLSLVLALVGLLLTIGGLGVWQAAWLRLRLASPEERERWEGIAAAREEVADDPRAFLLALESYLRDFGEEGWLADEVRTLRTRPVQLRANVYLLPSDGAEMVHVRGGLYRVGRDGARSRDLSAPHEVRLGGFLIDRSEVTNERYGRFLAEWQAAGRVHRCGRPDLDHAPPPTAASLSPDWSGPVVGLTPWDALEYARFYGRRLPSEEEWEVAASWDVQEGAPRPYPWGPSPPSDENRYLANLAWAEYGEVRAGEFVRICAPARMFPLDKSPFGLFDAGGNAAEWCQGAVPLPGPQPIRGGSVRTDSPEAALLAHRREHEPQQPAPPDVGFRTAIPFEGR